MTKVEVSIADDDALSDVLAKMREWLDSRQYQPTTFRCTFAAPCSLCTIDFAREAEAAEFARAFGGRIVAPTAGPLTPIP
jgi:hypothetical protein